MQNRPPPRTGDHYAIIGQRKANTDSRLLIDILAPASLECDLLDQLTHEPGHRDRMIRIKRIVRFACGDFKGQFAVSRIVGANLRTDAILELRDDLAAPVIGRRVGRKENTHIDFKPDRIAADLYVAFL